MLDPCLKIGPSRLGHRSLGERPSRFHKRRIIEQRERLLRSIRNRTIRGALFPRWCIEVGHHGMHKGALPMRVNATAILTFVAVRLVAALGEIK